MMKEAPSESKVDYASGRSEPGASVEVHSAAVLSRSKSRPRVAPAVSWKMEDKFSDGFYYKD